MSRQFILCCNSQDILCPLTRDCLFLSVPQAKDHFFFSLINIFFHKLFRKDYLHRNSQACTKSSRLPDPLLKIWSNEYTESLFEELLVRTKNFSVISRKLLTVGSFGVILSFSNYSCIHRGFCNCWDKLSCMEVNILNQNLRILSRPDIFQFPIIFEYIFNCISCLSLIPKNLFLKAVNHSAFLL